MTRARAKKKKKEKKNSKSIGSEIRWQQTGILSVTVQKLHSVSVAESEAPTQLQKRHNAN